MQVTLTPPRAARAAPERRASPRRVVALFTGGTISMRVDPAAGGAVPALSAEEKRAFAAATIAGTSCTSNVSEPGLSMKMARVLGWISSAMPSPTVGS